MSTTPRTDGIRKDVMMGKWVLTEKDGLLDKLEAFELELNTSRLQLVGMEAIESGLRADIAELNERLIDRQDTLMKQALRLTAMQRVINELYLDTEGYADGAPDASAHDKLCNQISSALHPFFKP